MKIIYTILFTLSFSLGASAQNPYINEFHYDNAGADANEFIEVAVPNTSTCTNIQVILYNGSGGASYDTKNLPADASVTNVIGSGTIYVINYPANGIQNGSPDGIALVCDGAVLQFLSYEGTFTATNGPATGLTSTDVVVAENNTTTTTTGSVYFTGGVWMQAETGATPGALNPGQTVLPVRLNYFSGSSTSFGNALKWSLASTDAASVILERSSNGSDFSPIHTSVSVQANRNETFTDNQPTKGANYYRLAMRGQDGSLAYSNVLQLQYDNNQTDATVVQANNTNSFRLKTIGFSPTYSIALFDVQGRMLMKKNNFSDATLFDMSAFGKGVYVLQITDGYSSKTIRFIK